MDEPMVNPKEDYATGSAQGLQAVLVVDVQNDYCHENGRLNRKDVFDFYSVEFTQKMIPRLEAFVSRAREARVPVIWIGTEYSEWTTSKSWLHRGSGRPLRICEPGTWGAEWYEPLHPSESELVVVKHRYSPFINTPLDTVLRARGIESVVITGVTTNVCVESTARDAFMRDYSVIAVSDCVASYDPEVHEASLRNIRTHFGAVRTSAEVVADWGHG